MNSPEERIKRAKELSEAATPDDFDFIDDEITTRRGGHLIAKIRQHGTSSDGRLFAEARTLLPAIAADYEKLQSEFLDITAQRDSMRAFIQGLGGIEEAKKLTAATVPCPGCGACNSRCDLGEWCDGKGRLSLATAVEWYQKLSRDCYAAMTSAWAERDREKARAQTLHRRLITAEAALGTKREIAAVMEENRSLREDNRRLKAYAEAQAKQAARRI